MKNNVVYLSLSLINAFLGLSAQTLNRIENRSGYKKGINTISIKTQTGFILIKLCSI